MPITALGRYEILVMHHERGIPFHRQTLFYAPGSRIMLTSLALMLIAGLFLRRMGRLKPHPSMWLAVPAGLAALLSAFDPSSCDDISGSPWYIAVGLLAERYGPCAIAQLTALTAVLAATSLFRRRAITGTFLAALGASELAALALFHDGVPFLTLTSGWGLWAATLPLSTIPALVAMRKRLSPARLVVAAGAAWGLTALMAAGVDTGLLGAERFGRIFIGGLADNVLYVIGFWLFVTLSAWWRTRLFRVYGVRRDPSDTPPA
jgi:hypothetical protein